MEQIEPEVFSVHTVNSIRSARWQEKDRTAWCIRGQGWVAGFFFVGRCWAFKYRKVRFYTCNFYTFWRFFLSIDR